jgi:hypothetical protein
VNRIAYFVRVLLHGSDTLISRAPYDPPSYPQLAFRKSCMRRRRHSDAS